MLLRRIIDHLKHQNWTAVALDFILVVFGVYLGLLLNETRERVALEQAARSSMITLYQDVSSDLDRLNLVADAQEIRIAALQRVTSALGTSIFSEAEIAKDIRLAADNNRTFLLRDSIYDAMKTSGELHVLPTELSQLISDTYAADLAYLSTATLQIWTSNNNIWTECINQYWNWDDEKLISQAPEDIARLRNCFATQRDTAGYYVHLVKVAHRRNAEDLKAALEAELK